MEVISFSWTDSTSTSRSISDLELSSLKYSISSAGQEIPVPGADPYYITLGYNNRTIDIKFRATSAQNTILANLFTEAEITIIAPSTGNTSFPEAPTGSKWAVSSFDDVAQPGSCGTREYTIKLTHRGDLE